MKFPVVLAICFLVSVGYVTADLDSWWGSVSTGAERFFNKTKNDLDKVGETIKDTANDWADKTKEGYESAKKGAEKIFDKTKDELQKFGDDVKDKAEDWAEKAKEGYETAKKEAGQFLDKTKVELEKFGDNVKDKAEGWVEKAKEDYKNAKKEAGQFLDKAKVELEEFGGDVKDKAEVWAEKVKEGYETAKKEAEEFLDKTKVELGKLGENVKDKAEDWAEKAKVGYENAKKEAGQFLDKTKVELEKFGDDVKEKTEDWAEKTKEGLKIAQDAIEEAFNKAVKESKEFSDDALNKTVQYSKKAYNKTKIFTDDALDKTNQFFQENYQKFLVQYEKNMVIAKELAAKVAVKFNELRKEFDIKYEEAKQEMEIIGLKLKDMAARSGEEMSKLVDRLQVLKDIVVEQYKVYQARAKEVLHKVVEKIRASREKVYVTVIGMAEEQFGKENVNQQECRQVINNVFMSTLKSSKSHTLPCFKALLKNGWKSLTNTTEDLKNASKAAYNRWKCDLSENAVKSDNCIQYESTDLAEQSKGLLSSVKDLGRSLLTSNIELAQCLIVNISDSVVDSTRDEVVTKNQCIKAEALMADDGINKFDKMVEGALHTVSIYNGYLEDIKVYLEDKFFGHAQQIAHLENY